MEQIPSWESNSSSATQEIPAFYGTWRFITAFTSARHLSLSWATSIQSIPPHLTSWRSFLILCSHLRLGLPSGLSPPGFPTKSLYTPPLSPIRATCPAPLIIIDLITRIYVRTFSNVIRFYSEELSAPRPTPKLEDHTLSAVRDCLFIIFPTTLHVYFLQWLF